MPKRPPTEASRPADRRPRLKSSVLDCELSIERSGQVFSKPRVMYLRLACGHVIRRRSRRRFLRGETVICFECERRTDAGVLELELKP